MLLLFLLLYVLACILLAYIARDRIIGFAGFLILSLLFTPLIMFIVFVLGMRRRNAA